MQQAAAATALPDWDEGASERPRFSIVIPVRNRGITLPATLQTCMAQTFSDFEVVVSDNESQDGTADVVEACGDERIRLVRTPAFYAMTDNFEFALRHTRGNYLIYIGGDDGFYPWSLAYLDAIIRRMPSDCYDWDPPHFIWPHEKKAIVYCDFSHHLKSPWRETTAEAEARLSAPTVMSQPLLTGFNIYHGCVSRALIGRVINAQGRYFEGPCPDLSASLDNLLHTEGTVHVGAPVSIAGLSQFSNGWAFTAGKPTPQQEVIRAEFIASNEKLRSRHIPINEVSTSAGPYLGGFVAFWFKRHGDLRGFPHQAWRALYARELGLHNTHELDAQCAAYSSFAAFLRANGAVDAAPLAPEDIPLPQAGSTSSPKEAPIPDLMLAMARGLRVQDPDERFTLFKMFQWEGRLMAEVESAAQMLTVADHAAIMARLLSLSGDSLASLDDDGRSMLEAAIQMRAAAMIAGVAL